MNENQIMSQWKKSSIRIGSPTNILAALTAFIPVIWLCSTYDCWPPMSTVLTAWGMIAASFAGFYFVEPISYYASLGMTGTYLSFLSGNIGNMRVPCAALALDVTDSTPGTIQAEVVSTMAICGSIITNLIGTTSAVIVGAGVLAILPEFIASGLTKYASSAIFGATFGNFAIKYPKVAVFALIIPILLKKFTPLPAALVIVCTVFGTLFIARFMYKKGMLG
ncbi:MAG: hypothetical protein HFG18_00620 [Oscillospiraceae bacterium]|nr:hypothetical protein [Oscillospiraceae bacterium]MCI9362971.1 hypothetical protein [Oscillospiraceae bacterium]RKJ55310.1 hypothetical protein D7X25_08180 [bacterium 1XD42-8]RKJ66430.1 hypothetical protein D7Y09_03845 [bacterium 1XD42-1]